MNESLQLLQEVFKDFGQKDTFTNTEEFSADKAIKWLDIVDHKLLLFPEDLLLLALKSELLVYDEPKAAITIAQLVIEKTFDEVLQDETRKARGIAFYVLALECDERHHFAEHRDTLNFFRKSLELFPAHWNAAASFSDHALEGHISYDEAINYITQAIDGNNDPSIIQGFLNQAAYISHRTDDSAAVKYYESSKAIGGLSSSQAAYLAICYARIGRYAEALKNFRESWESEKSDNASNRKIYPHFISVKRGYAKKIIWDLVAEAVKHYNQQSTDRNLIFLGMSFKYLPSINSSFVIDDVREKLTTRSDVRDIAEVFGIHENLALSKEIKMSDADFFRIAEKSIEQINMKLKDKQRNHPKPFQVPPVRIKTFDIFNMDNEK